jgi:hypothetical protein
MVMKMINCSFNFENFVITEALFDQYFNNVGKNEKFNRFKHLVFSHYLY